MTRQGHPWLFLSVLAVTVFLLVHGQLGYAFVAGWVARELWRG